MRKFLIATEFTEKYFGLGLTILNASQNFSRSRLISHKHTRNTYTLTRKGVFFQRRRSNQAYTFNSKGTWFLSKIFSLRYFAVNKPCKHIYSRWRDKFLHCSKVICLTSIRKYGAYKEKVKKKVKVNKLKKKKQSNSCAQSNE